MKPLLIVAAAGLVGWQIYHLGYRNGLKGSPEYAAAISAKLRADTEAEMLRLEQLANSPPSFEQCVPIIQGSKLDEYAFCEDLLSAHDERMNNGDYWDESYCSGRVCP